MSMLPLTFLAKTLSDGMFDASYLGTLANLLAFADEAVSLDVNKSLEECLLRNSVWLAGRAELCREAGLQQLCYALLDLSEQCFAKSRSLLWARAENWQQLPLL